jgi:molybdate transport system substrate-binding protein
VLKQSGHADLAQEFVDLVTGSAGERVLSKAGFGRP